MHCNTVAPCLFPLVYKPAPVYIRYHGDMTLGQLWTAVNIACVKPSALVEKWNFTHLERFRSTSLVCTTYVKPPLVS